MLPGFKPASTILSDGFNLFTRREESFNKVLMNKKFDFANILFAGPCNRSCPYCIGKKLPARVNHNNLESFPLPGQESLIKSINDNQIKNIVFTGTISDPQLYQFQSKLLTQLRSCIGSDINFSIHTNGALTLKQIDIFNQYDKACLSIPSFRKTTYKIMMGSGSPPDIKKILKQSRIPVKVSCVIAKENRNEIDDFLKRCSDYGIERVVLRNLFHDNTNWELFKDIEPDHYFCQNPVYYKDGMQITLWDFYKATAKSINLYPNGKITESYLLNDL